MAEIKVPIQVNLPDDWVEQIVERLKNDHESEWAQVVRCKDCKWFGENDFPYTLCHRIVEAVEDNDFCSYGERREDG